MNKKNDFQLAQSQRIASQEADTTNQSCNMQQSSENMLVHQPHMKTHPSDLDKFGYANRIKKTLEQSRRAGEKELQVRYHGLNRELKRLLEECGGYLHYFDISSEKDCYKRYKIDHEDRISNIEGAVEYLINGPYVEGFLMIGWTKKYVEGEPYFEEICDFYDFWQALDQDVRETYDMLDAIGLCPKEPVATLKDIERAENDVMKNFKF